MDDSGIPFTFKDPERTRLVGDLIKYRDAVLGQYSASKAKFEADAEAARQRAENDLREQYASLPEEIRKQDYAGIKADFAAAAKRIQYQHQLSLIDPNDPSADTRIKMLNEKFPAKERLDFKDTDDFKTVVAAYNDNNERVTMANNLHDQLLKMKDALDRGDKTLAANIGKTGVMKSINSLQGKDAVSSSEQSTRYQDLLSLPDILIQSGEGGLLKTVLSRVAMAKQKGDSKAYNSAISEWNSLASKAVESDPERFFRTAYDLHNAAVETASRGVDRVVNMSSPYHAEKILKVQRPLVLPEITPSSASAVAPPSASQYAQTAPAVSVGPSGKTTILTGTSQAAPQQQQPQQAAPARSPLEEEMIKRGLLKPR
jgi:hypothetical protein